MKKILFSVFTIAAMAAMVIAGTTAFFSDSETSSGNVFTAGGLDLKVDNECHYNGQPCLEISQIITGWEETDLGPAHKFFYFNDVKPGDWGEDTISLHVVDNDAWGSLVLNNILDKDRTCTEPELDTEADCLPDNDGELRENLRFWVWLDQGETPGFQGEGDIGEGDNLHQIDSEPILITPGPIDSEGEVWDLAEGLSAVYQLSCLDGEAMPDRCRGLNPDGHLTGSVTYYFAVAWELPPATGNEAQSDIFGADMVFQAEQYRHNGSPFGGGGDGPGSPENITVYFGDMGANPQYGYYHDYSTAVASFTYQTPATNVLTSTVTATGLKPYATYQVKFEGKPVCAGGSDDQGNEDIGYLGRWWNNTTPGNVNDAYYEANSVYKGGTECIIGYLVWDFLTADSSGSAVKALTSDNSYHVLWSGGGVCDTNVNSFLSALDPAHPGVLFSPADKVNGEIERFTCGGLVMPGGNYNLNMILNEESFHQGPGTWTAVMDTNINFTIN